MMTVIVMVMVTVMECLVMMTADAWPPTLRRFSVEKYGCGYSMSL